jgi:hypothetical protein
MVRGVPGGVDRGKTGAHRATPALEKKGGPEAAFQ